MAWFTSSVTELLSQRYFHFILFYHFNFYYFILFYNLNMSSLDEILQSVVVFQ